MTIIDILAVLGSVFGALLVANGDTKAALVGYICFIIGSICSIYLLFNSNASASLTYINVYFLIVNFYGVYKRLKMLKNIPAPTQEEVRAKLLAKEEKIYRMTEPWR